MASGEAGSSWRFPPPATDGQARPRWPQWPNKDGSSNAILGHNQILALLGTFIRRHQPGQAWAEHDAGSDLTDDARQAGEMG